MKVTECDKCHKIFQAKYTNSSVINDMALLPHELDSHGNSLRSADLCEDCTSELYFIIRDFLGYPEVIIQTAGDPGEYGKPDGETEATGSWGGAGPDCCIEQLAAA